VRERTACTVAQRNCTQSCILHVPNKGHARTRVRVHVLTAAPSAYIGGVVLSCTCIKLQNGAVSALRRGGVG